MDKFLKPFQSTLGGHVKLIVPGGAHVIQEFYGFMKLTIPLVMV
jgi:hypothetical protein